jgi:hypothetical protein
MRRVFCVLALVLSACGPEFAVVPRGNQPQLSAQAPMGITLAAHSEQWQGSPFDLADYVTPILVELYNPGPYEVRVSLVDFGLRDAHGTRYGAINPFIPAVLGQADDGTLEKPVLLAARGGFVGGIRGGGGFRGSVRSYSYGPSTRGGVGDGPPPVRRPGAYGSWAGGGGFYISPGLRGFYGPSYLYWDYPFLRPPYYWDWVFWWGPSFYPSMRPSPDVLESAVPEGVLPPNSRIAGFLYFKKATGAGQHDLDLTWELVDARTNASLGSLHVPLEIVHR